jgi:hypothetical protein
MGKMGVKELCMGLFFFSSFCFLLKQKGKKSRGGGVASLTYEVAQMTMR